MELIKQKKNRQNHKMKEVKKNSPTSREPSEIASGSENFKTERQSSQNTLIYESQTDQKLNEQEIDVDLSSNSPISRDPNFKSLGIEEIVNADKFQSPDEVLERDDIDEIPGQRVNQSIE